MEQTLTNLHLLAEGLERDLETWMVHPNGSTDSYMLCRRTWGGVQAGDLYCNSSQFPVECHQWNSLWLACR